MIEERGRKVKGIIIEHMFAWIKERFGEEGWQKYCSFVENSEQKIVAGDIDRVNWYSFDIYLNFLYLTRDVFDLEDTFFENLGDFGAQDAFNTFYRFLAKVLTVKSTIDRAPLFWRRYHNFGIIEVHRLDKGKIKMVLFNCSTLPEIYLHVIKGWTESVLRIAGVENCRIKFEKCKHEQEYAIIFDIRHG